MLPPIRLLLLTAVSAHGAHGELPGSYDDLSDNEPLATRSALERSLCQKNSEFNKSTTRLSSNSYLRAASLRPLKRPEPDHDMLNHKPDRANRIARYTRHICNAAAHSAQDNETISMWPGEHQFWRHENFGTTASRTRGQSRVVPDFMSKIINNISPTVCHGLPEVTNPFRLQRSGKAPGKP